MCYAACQQRRLTAPLHSRPTGLSIIPFFTLEKIDDRNTWAYNKPTVFQERKIIARYIEKIQEHVSCVGASFVIQSVSFDFVMETNNLRFVHCGRVYKILPFIQLYLFVRMERRLFEWNCLGPIRYREIRFSVTAITTPHINLKFWRRTRA